MRREQLRRAAQSGELRFDINNVYMIPIFGAEAEDPERGTGNVIKEETLEKRRVKL